MNVLVTGATGFAGQHLTQRLAAAGYHVYGTYKDEPRETPPRGVRLLHCDVCDFAQVLKVIRSTQPQYVCHLAAFSSVAASPRSADQTIETNLGGTVNLLEAVRHAAPHARVLVVGSGACYASPARKATPVKESVPLTPRNPYARGKAAADLVAWEYFRTFGLRVIRARPFNHTGPGQSREYVCSDFAAQVAAIELGLKPAVVSVGNISVRRDFTDVRDVARAYQLLLEKGKPGEAYNIAAGRAVPLTRVLSILCALSSKTIRVQVERRRLRAGEPRVLCGSYDKLRRATGWSPQIPLRQTLEDLYGSWMELLAR